MWPISRYHDFYGNKLKLKCFTTLYFRFNNKMRNILKHIIQSLQLPPWLLLGLRAWIHCSQGLLPSPIFNWIGQREIQREEGEKRYLQTSFTIGEVSAPSAGSRDLNLGPWALTGCATALIHFISIACLWKCTDSMFISIACLW